MKYWALILLVWLPQLSATISNDFYDFLVKSRGADVAGRLARKDFFGVGSFGGGNHVAGTKTQRHPVVFVNGWASNSYFASLPSHTWVNRGYAPEELYSFTYGSSLGFFAFHSGMNCEHVKQTRDFIMAVNEYTNNTVDVVSYSMGAPLARKAIMGGKCVETGEDIGPPIGHLVENFLGVGGAMRGALICGIAAMSVCNRKNGMHCNSEFLNDINSKKGYEGRNRYALQSRHDEVVGYEVCGGKRVAEFDGAQVKTVDGYGHIGLLMLTGDQQFDLLAGNEKDLQWVGGEQQPATDQDRMRPKPAPSGSAVFSR